MAKRVNSIDILKIIATVMIVFHHYQQVTETQFVHINFYGGKFYFGYLVEFFFMVSGFWMCSYIERIPKEISFVKYYIKRATRLLPMVAISALFYEVFIVIYMQLYKMPWKGQGVTLWGYITTALGIQEGWGIANSMVNSPTWYVSVLMWCYILLYFICYICWRMNWRPVYAFLCMIFIGIGVQTYAINLPFLNSQMARGYYSFFAGLLLAILIPRIQHKRRVNIISAIVIILFASIILVDRSVVDTGINYLLVFLIYPSMIILCINSAWGKRITSCIVTELANISFNVYVWHAVFFILVDILRGLGMITINIHSFASMCIYTLLMYVFGGISYYLIDKPISRLLKNM